jgi:hypothetical protein
LGFLDAFMRADLDFFDAENPNPNNVIQQGVVILIFDPVFWSVSHLLN